MLARSKADETTKQLRTTKHELDNATASYDTLRRSKSVTQSELKGAHEKLATAEARLKDF